MTAISVKPKRKSKKRDVVFPVVNTIILCLIMVITLYPVVNTVAISLSDGLDAARGGITIAPRKWSTEAYADLLNDPDIFDALKISVSKTIIITVLNLFFTSMLAFALSRKEYILRRFITVVLVLTMYINAGLIPSYLLIMNVLKLGNSYAVYIIPSLFSCFNMIIIRTYICGLPDALVESARIDGASDITAFFRVILPLCLPVLATVALFVAVGSWNSWFDTRLYNGSEKKLYTLQYVLNMRLATSNQSSNAAQSSVDALANQAQSKTTPLTVRCATTVVASVPILIIYPFLQRYFVTGMALGSVKG